jgi:signal transduction histidine kinase/integral membrane sensor domain MASE1
MIRLRGRTVRAMLALSAVYFCTGKLGLFLAYLHPSASAVWPPSGIALAALLLWGYRLWPGIFVGAFLVNITTAGSLETTLGIAAGNTLEGLLGAWLINRFAGGPKAFERARNIFRFTALAALVSTAVGATVGVTALSLEGFVQWQQYAAIWLTWWLGDMAGDLLVAPLLVIWVTQPYPHLNTNRILEAAGVLLLLMLSGYIVFLAGSRFLLESIVILPLLWAAFRFGQRGAVTAAFLMSSIALAGTLGGTGPFVTRDLNESLLHLQGFMGTVALAGLVLASVITERVRVEQHLQVRDTVSRILADSRDLGEAGSKILQVFCERTGWSAGAIWRLDPASTQLMCLEFWHLPSVEIPRFRAATFERRFASGVGLPGRVWSSGNAAWISDVTKDDNFPRASLAAEEGLRAAFGFPIKLEDEIFGMIECFSRETREPDDHFLGMVTDIGGQLGQFIERKRAEELLSRAREELLKTNQDLERRVRKRTAELEQTNATLLKHIEEQKSLEEQLRQAQKMESIGTLAGGIAHDFNNVLNIIRGYATLIGRQLCGNLEIADSLKIIDQEIERGASMVRQLLTIARKTEILLAATNANEVVLTVSELIKQTFPKTIDLELHLDRALPPVMADPNQLSQALLNLCVNARDAMPTGGKLRIKTAPIDATEMRHRHPGCGTDPHVCIVIADTGMGIDEGVRQRIFEPFFTTKPFGQGTGLGLAMVYGIVKNHNGIIDVESEPGQGTIFRLYLPILRTDKKFTVDEIGREETLGGQGANYRGTILVVEDEEHMLQLLRKVLLQAGYQILAATDGRQAIDLYQHHKQNVDIALVDLGLPKSSGSEVIRALKEQNPRVEIIVATGYLEPELKSDLLRAGVRDYVQKPYQVNDVLEKLTSIMNKT